MSPTATKGSAAARRADASGLTSRPRGPTARALVILLALVASLLSACTAGHTVLGTGSSSCFKALPAAADAVHHSGTLAGVRRVTLGQIVRPSRLRLDTSIPNNRNETVCAVAYKGNFTREGVEKGGGRPSGTLAVVVLRASDDQLITTLLFDRLPLRFRHLGLL